MYMLAGTPSSDFGYPVTLYNVVDGKLRTVREVLPETQGLRSVQHWNGEIFLVHSPWKPGTVTILHADDPMRIDEVTFYDKPGEFFVADSLTALSEPRPSLIDELLPSSEGEFDSNSAVLFNVSNREDVVRPRVQLNTWDEYTSLRVEGQVGGPVPNHQLIAAVVGNDLVFLPGWRRVVLDSVPQNLRETANATPRHTFAITAATQRYLLLQVEYNGQELSSGKAGDSTGIYVHDRIQDRWKTIQIEGNVSRSRLFDNWLASIVASFDVNNRPSLGQQNQRSVGGRGRSTTSRLPDVRMEFARVWSGSWLPGVLLLDNIVDNRRIRIETSQADSEVLSVRGNTVYYRVNDAIYQTEIIGGQLRNTSLLVKDENVPEVHWIFWGP
jgi:hypothetical protein